MISAAGDVDKLDENPEAIKTQLDSSNATQWRSRATQIGDRFKKFTTDNLLSENTQLLLVPNLKLDLKMYVINHFVFCLIRWSVFASQMSDNNRCAMMKSRWVITWF